MSTQIKKLKLKELVAVDDRFQNSINIQLDLNKTDKVLSYIPTKSSVEILDRYLQNVIKDSKEKSTLLIGPYGKGKSHLILVMLSILSSAYSEEEESIVYELGKKIEQNYPETYEMLSEIRASKKRFLPIIISNTQMDLNQAYLVALNEALKRAGLKDITPDTYFTEAIAVINKWEKEYQSAYKAFVSNLRKEKIQIVDLILGLESCNKESLELFMKIYPLVTAGSTFNPMLNMDILTLYQKVNDIICNDYGYTGMFIVFDEFSKYIEGHSVDTIAADMKILQDVCELANATKGNQIHTLFVAHKSIKEYNNVLPREIINAFTGVEGRLKEVLFISSGKNNYELIQNAIYKKEKFYKCTDLAKELDGLVKDSYSMPAFHTLFNLNDFKKIVVEGCFPLTPISAYLLLGISEKVAQNERTLFTFISKDEPFSMARFIREHTEKNDHFITANLIFDYFKGIFKTDVSNVFNHSEWLKADYALKQANTLDEVKVIKTLAILNIMSKEEEIPPVKSYLALASGLLNSEIDEVLEQLQQREIIDYRTSTEQYYFKNNVAVDLEREIKRKVNLMSENINYIETLESLSTLDYVLPKVHNQKYCIKRFFDYKFIKAEDYLNIKSSKVLFSEKNTDGKILLLISESKVELDKCKEHASTLNDERIVVVAPNNKFSKIKQVKQYCALQLLKQDSKFLENNKIMEEELLLFEEELVYQINDEIERLYDFTNSKTKVFHVSLEQDCRNIKSSKDFNRLISKICDKVYYLTPLINNEMINKSNISTQIKTARNALVNKILSKEDMSALEKGTSPEASIFRSTLIYSGVSSQNYEVNEGLVNVLNEIKAFIMDSENGKKSFDILYTRLLSAPYGMRRGSIPIYIAICLRLYENMPVIYIGDREVSVNVEVLSGVNDKPEEYSLYVVKGTNDKNQYLNNMGTLFDKYSKSRDQGESLIIQVVSWMQRWMQSLPKVSSNFNNNDEVVHLSETDFECLMLLRKNLKKIDCNSKELLFDKIPSIYNKKTYQEIYMCIEQLKRCCDEYLDNIMLKAIDMTKEVFKTGHSEDLAISLKEWYKNQSETAKTVLINSKVSNFMGYISSLDTYDEKEIINKLSKIVLDMYIENWRTDSLYEFIDSINQMKQEIELTIDDNMVSKNKITLTSEDGELVRYYDSDSSDSTSYFLKNEISSIMDEFGDSLEVNQKVSVLVQIINELIK